MPEQRSATPEIPEELQRVNERLLVRMLRWCLSIIVVTICVVAATELTVQGPKYPTLFILGLTQVVIVLVVLQMLRRPQTRRWIVPIGVGVIAVVYLSIASADVIAGGGPTTALMICAIAIGTSALLPWGFRPQLFTVSVAGIALLANVSFFASGILSEGYALGSVVAIAVVLLCSVAIAGRLQHFREKSMLEHLRLVDAEDRLRCLSEELEDRVSDRTAELETANRELESFSYAVSHDLRAPLRTVSGFAEALMEDYADQLDREGLRHVERVRAATERMRELVDGLLELSRLSRAEIERTSVDLTRLAKDVVEELTQESPNHEVDCIIAEDMNAAGDPRMLRVLITNLLGNSWKYTEPTPEPHVEFGTSEYGGQTVYFVNDNGVGFDAKERDKLFVAFERLSGDYKMEGSGIGLATAARIIDRHGGRIWAEGTPGEGATFYFTLNPATP